MVISGESGSGKTETTRHIIHWLTTTQNKRSSTLGLAQSILGAGELLEVRLKTFILVKTLEISPLLDVQVLF